MNDLWVGPLCQGSKWAWIKVRCTSGELSGETYATDRRGRCDDVGALTQHDMGGKVTTENGNICAHFKLSFVSLIFSHRGCIP